MKRAILKDCEVVPPLGEVVESSLGAWATVGPSFSIRPVRDGRFLKLRLWTPRLRSVLTWPGRTHVLREGLNELLVDLTPGAREPLAFRVAAPDLEGPGSSSPSIALLRAEVLERLETVPDSAIDFWQSHRYPRQDPSGPFTFGSEICRAAHFRLPLYRYWCRRIGDEPRFLRKQWEFVYIIHALQERSMLVPGARGLGFGVGREPLVALFASMGVQVVATDLEEGAAKASGWVDSHQHAADPAVLNEKGLCPPDAFDRNVSFRPVNMNEVPDDLRGFDFCWSACAFEHLGSIEKGLRFVRSSLACLRPGGVAVHTTELNLSSDESTIDDGPTVLFRRSDLWRLVEELRRENVFVEPLDLEPGTEPFDQHVDVPPYGYSVHLRLKLGEFTTTSVGLVLRAPS